ncbi:MAG: DUF5615 family PIN-like protein [Planctomycetes bacterium]|nr:DUF5615 family PIN-like protein [Planctomycetota bacterium]
MSLRFYFDVNVHGAAATQLRSRGIDVLRAQDDGQDQARDPDLLDRAVHLGRILVTFDRDFLAEARRRQTAGRIFPGIVYGHQDFVSVGQLVRDLQLMDGCMEPTEFENLVFYLPI